MAVNTRTVTYPTDITRIILFGGSPILLASIPVLKTAGYAIEVYTSPRQMAEDMGGLSLGEALDRADVTWSSTEDINDSFPLDDAANAIGFGFGEAWSFGPDIRSAFGDRLIDYMGIPLPRYRGGAHYSWAIMRGDRSWGGALQLVTDKTEPGVYDDGEIICAWDYIIPQRCTIPQHWFDYCGDYDAFEIKQFLDAVRAGKSFQLFRYTTEKSLFFPRLKTADNGWIDWNGSAQSVTNTINAFDHPYPGARTMLYSPDFGDRQVVMRGVVPECTSPQSVAFQRGLVIDSGASLVVACADGDIRIHEVLCNGKNITNLIPVGVRFITPTERLDQAMRVFPHYTPKHKPGSTL